MHSTDRTEHMRTGLWATSWYRSHGYNTVYRIIAEIGAKPGKNKISFKIEQ